MSQLLRISPSGPALALVVSILLSSGVQADSPHGTDAPDTPGTSTSGDNGSSSADSAAGASGSNGGLSKTAQIVIGVVVGVVCLTAIGFGIWFFLRKKRKWDEQTKRYETINAFRKSAGNRRQNEMSLRQSQRRRRRDRDLERGGNDNVETSESELPKYDPSTFQHHKNEYSIDSTRGLSIDLARHSFMDNRYQHQRNSSQLSGVMPPPPPGPAPGRGSTSMEMTSPLDMSRGASPTEGAGHSNADSPTPMLQGSGSGGGARGGIRGTFKVPKKPKPVLTRLITNL